MCVCHGVPQVACVYVPLEVVHVDCSGRSIMANLCEDVYICLSSAFSVDENIVLCNVGRLIDGISPDPV